MLPVKIDRVHPCLPIVSGLRGDEQQKTHCNGEDSECEPCLCIKLFHNATYL